MKTTEHKAKCNGYQAAMYQMDSEKLIDALLKLVATERNNCVGDNVKVSWGDETEDREKRIVEFILNQG